VSLTFLILGMLGLAVAILEAVTIVTSYVRHLPSMDQAGAALGLYFLIGWIAPVAAALVTVGAVPLRLREQAAGRPVRPELAISHALAVLGLLLAAFTALFAFEVVRDLIPLDTAHRIYWEGLIGYLLYAAFLIALSSNVLGLAAALRRGLPAFGGGGPRWLVPLLAMLAPVPLLTSAALMIAGVPSTGPLWTATLVWAVVTLRAESRADPAPAS
jgi:hypothetical protein